MNKKFKLASAFLAASLIVTPVSSLINNFDNVAKANSYNKTIEETQDIFSESDLAYIDLLDKMPMEIAEGNIDNGVKWLNENKTSNIGFGKFVAVNGNIRFQSYYRSWECAWEITKALASNFIPWGRILKIKKLATGLGGIGKLSTLLYNAAKHQKNLGYGNVEALKRAAKIVFKNFPDRDAEAIYQVLAIDGVIRSCT